MDFWVIFACCVVFVGGYLAFTHQERIERAAGVPEEDSRGSPIFIVLFWVVIGVGALICLAAIFSGGYAH
jgi:hypothetical protein